MKLLLDRFDKDGNGQLDVNEFVGFYAEVKAMYRIRASLYDYYDLWQFSGRWKLAGSAIYAYLPQVAVH